MEANDFRSLYDRYFNLVSRCLARYRLPAEECEDIVQATFLSLWEYARVNHVRSPAGFLVAAARNRAISSLRRRKRQATDSLEDCGELCDSHAATQDAGLGRELDERESRIALVQAALKEHARGQGDDTLWQRYVLGRKLADIATSRKEPLGTICARVNARRIPKKLSARIRTDVERMGESPPSGARP